MPIKVKLDDLDTSTEDDLALDILAGYREGVEKQKEQTKEKEEKKDLEK